MEQKTKLGFVSNNNSGHRNVNADLVSLASKNLLGATKLQDFGDLFFKTV